MRMISCRRRHGHAVAAFRFDLSRSGGKGSLESLFVSTRMDSSINWHDGLFALDLTSSITIIGIGIYARCWLLVAGYLVRLPFDLELLFLKVQRMFGLVSDEFDHLSVEPPHALFVLNRILVASSIILITAGIVQLLCRYSRLRHLTLVTASHSNESSA